MYPFSFQLALFVCLVGFDLYIVRAPLPRLPTTDWVFSLQLTVITVLYRPADPGNSSPEVLFSSKEVVSS